MLLVYPCVGNRQELCRRDKFRIQRRMIQRRMIEDWYERLIVGLMSAFAAPDCRYVCRYVVLVVVLVVLFVVLVVVLFVVCAGCSL